MKIIRRCLIATGQVQGVGFRPFVYRLAREECLTGFVNNTSEGVRIEVQGAESKAARFESRLMAEMPPLARIIKLSREDLPTLSEESVFSIGKSLGSVGHSVLISPDMGICSECRIEMRDPANRRFAYPFTNCTSCGPRYSITCAIPYDRASTTMACFPLCPDCAREYANPADRRFHAQPIACPTCGPHLWFVTKGNGASSFSGENQREALDLACRILLDGGILALKGLGGFQLVCNARDARSVDEIRRRKARPHKPLALMVGEVAVARDLCLLTPEHEALLQSPESPVVVCPRRKNCPLPKDIAPDVDSLGVMLPYTPLHAALFDRLSGLVPLPPVLVMTSGNPHGEPLCLGNREALSRLADMADAFLLHDRDILTRVDDSVLSPGMSISPPVDRGLTPSPLFLRRARGYVPYPVSLPQEGAAVLGVGAELKSTVCLAYGIQAFVGQHVGDLKNPAALKFYEEVVNRLESLLAKRPQAIVCDLHPDFLSTRYACERAMAEGLPLWKLQHHAAHAAAVLAENNCYDAALALCLDGSGLGDDGSIWGGEVLFMDISEARWQRMGCLASFSMPGGEAAIREPWRCAMALQEQCSPGLKNLSPFAEEYEQAVPIVLEMLARGINCPRTSSCGRLFDAVAAQLGLCFAVSYEGQAAIRLEAAADMRLVVDFAADRKNFSPWPIPIVEGEGLFVLGIFHLFARVLEAQQEGQSIGAIAARFHVSLAWGLADMAERIASRINVRKVGLSGGVMQNGIMSALLPFCLRERGLQSLTHHELPPGDGGLSLGQAVWGRSIFQNES